MESLRNLLVYDHQNISRRTETHLERRHYVILVVSRGLYLRCIIKGNRSNGRRADRLRCSKHRRTIRAETGCAASMPISSLMVRDEVIRFCRADIICLSSST